MYLSTFTNYYYYYYYMNFIQHLKVEHIQHLFPDLVLMSCASLILFMKLCE